MFFYNINSIFNAKDIEVVNSRFFINESLYTRLDDDLRGDFSYNQRHIWRAYLSLAMGAARE